VTGQKFKLATSWAKAAAAAAAAAAALAALASVAVHHPASWNFCRLPGHSGALSTVTAGRRRPPERARPGAAGGHYDCGLPSLRAARSELPVTGQKFKLATSWAKAAAAAAAAAAALAALASVAVCHPASWNFCRLPGHSGALSTVTAGRRRPPERARPGAAGGHYGATKIFKNISHLLAIGSNQVMYSSCTI
jgi:hypothetical protein